MRANFTMRSGAGWGGLLVLLIFLGWTSPVYALDGGQPPERVGDLGGGPAENSVSGPSDAGPDAEPLPDWAPSLTATLAPTAAHVGDPIKMTITVRHKQGVSVNLPLKLELGKFTELSRDETSKKIGAKGQIPRHQRIFILEVAAFELGEQVLPPIDVTALGSSGQLITLRTMAIPVQITSVMKNEPKPKLRELEPPIAVFQRTWWFVYLMIGLGALIIVSTATLIISRRSRRRRERQRPPPPPVLPHLRALEQLEQLDLEAFIEQERYKELYLLLSEIIREYVGGRWRFDALEMTTTEINAVLSRRDVGAPIRERLQSFFNSCDLVKFAKYRPDPDVAREAHAEAEMIVRDTRELMISPGPADPGPGREKPGPDRPDPAADRGDPHGG